MFDATAYFEGVSRAIKSCEGYSTISGLGVKVYPDYESWERIDWVNTIDFSSSGHRLQILEIHRKQGRDHLRKVKYHLRDGSDPKILLVDVHGRLVPFDEPCHLHFGGEVFQDDDARLRGTSLREFGFMQAFDWTCRIIEGRPLPWQE